MWRQVLARDADGLQEYNALLLSVPEYAGATVDGLLRILGGRQGELWIFDSGREFQVALGVSVDHTGPGGAYRLKIVNAVPVGEFEPRRAMELTIEKVREILDRRQIERWYTKSQASYADRRLNEFAQAADELMWEIQKVNDHAGGCWGYEGRRDPMRKHEDAVMRGPVLRFRRRLERRNEEP